MVRRGRPGVWISILIASLLLAILATAALTLRWNPEDQIGGRTASWLMVGSRWQYSAMM
jgi:hypothetical protein